MGIKVVSFVCSDKEARVSNLQLVQAYLKVRDLHCDYKLLILQNHGFELTQHEVNMIAGNSRDHTSMALWKILLHFKVVKPNSFLTTVESHA